MSNRRYGRKAIIMGRKSSKSAILDAAERVILRQGLAATTIESVAAEAGLSKGGLFYHFATKKEMLLQLMERYQEQFLHTRQELYDDLPAEPGRLLKATILASLQHPAKVGGNNISNVLTLLDDMEMRSKVSEMRMKLFEELSHDYPHPEKIALAILATDGMWLMGIFGHSFPGGNEKLIDELLRLVDIHVTRDMTSAPA